tara:strand:- start:732 stop:1406 length:675 start_codon:yes stop_codon:yes gene_type:complete
MDQIKQIIEEKNTRLCFSADFKKQSTLFGWINLVGPHICILKTHIDILEDYDSSVNKKLIQLKEKYNFLILEDRKFSDIGKTFYRQLDGFYNISEYADIITIHGICAEGMLSYAKKNNRKIPKILIVSQMSSIGNIIDTNYTLECYNIAKKYREHVIGFISQTRFVKDSSFLFLTPGVRLFGKTLGDQKYNTPKEAFNNGSDVIIVGSGIYTVKYPMELIDQYK